MTSSGTVPNHDKSCRSTPRVYDDIVEYLESEKKVSEEGIAQVTEMMPVFAGDFVAYEDMKPCPHLS